MIRWTLPLPSPPMKTSRPMPREQLLFAVVLILLSVLAVLLWLNDPNRPPPGKSRVGWPAPVQAKP